MKYCISLLDLNPIIRLRLSASSDETRYALMGVCLDFVRKEACATDGRILARVPLNPGINGFGEFSGRILLSPEFLKAAAKIKPRDQRLYEAIITEETSVLASPEHRQEFKNIDSALYPNWSLVLPSKMENPKTITFDAALLLKLTDSLRETPRTIVTLEFMEPNCPILVKVQDQEGILMPCRT